MAVDIPPDAKKFLEELRFAVLATINRNGTPQQSIIWYELQGDEVLMNTKRGRVKDRNLIRDPRASICVEDQYRYVMLSGRVTLIDDQSIAQADIKRLATRYQDQDQAERQMRDVFSKEQRITIRLGIEKARAYGFSS